MSLFGAFGALPPSLKDAMYDDPDRFVALAYSQNSNIKDFDEFMDAIYGAFSTDRGRNASRHFDDDVLKFLFESPANRDAIRDNVDNEEYRRLFSIQPEEIEPQPVGEPPAPVIEPEIEKPIRVRPHARAGFFRIGYHRSYMKWTPAQLEFLRVRKVQKTRPALVAKEYNEHFQENRPKSSISTRYYRL